MPTPELTQLLSNGLQLLYFAHQQGATQAQDCAANSSSPTLKRAFKAGVKQNGAQAERLEGVFKAAGLAPKGKPDPAMQGIIEANKARIAATHDATERDLLNIAYAQLAAHYYLAGYGTLRNYARALGNREAVRLLTKTLDETSALDSKFTALANGVIAKAGKSDGGAASGSGLSWTLVLASLVGVGLAYSRRAGGDSPARE